MRIVVQRVTEASVSVAGIEKGRIGQGLLILLGITEGDQHEDIEWQVNKIVQMRIFNDDDGRLNLSMSDLGHKTLVVSQFTLYGSLRKGNRPSFVRAAKPEKAVGLYEAFVLELKKHVGVETGEFGADMDLHLINQGPLTFVLDSKMKDY